MDTIKKLTYEETPHNYKDFITKWKNDRVFRNRGKCSGIYVRKNGDVYFANGDIYEAEKDLKLFY